MAAALKVRERGFHRVNKHELKKLLTSFDKESHTVLKVLIKLLDSQDEKIRLDACKLFYSTQLDATKQINDDDLRRLVANAQFKGPKELEVDEPEDNTPLVDFTNIQDVE